MKSIELIQKRFSEMDSQMRSMQCVTNGDFPYFHTAEWRKWATSAQNVIKAALGEESPHYQHFVKAYSDCTGEADSVDSLKGIFLAAKSDFEGGYSFNLQATISGEVYADLLKLAKEALAQGATNVSAVLACAALEDALKRYASLNGLDVDNKSMQEVVGALKSKGLVTGAQKSLLDTMPKIRDYAMHANWDKITSQDVGSVIGYVEQLLLTKFS